MTAKISKWGNSQGLRVPKDIMEDLHLSIGDTVNITVENEKVIIEPIKNNKVKYNLNKLIAQIPSDYKTKEEFTKTIGNEEW